MNRLIPLCLALVGATAIASCSLLLQWNEDGNPCNADKKCFDENETTGQRGYTCLVKTCVLDDSLGETETCQRDKQCQQHLQCAPNFQCLKPCTTYYSTPAACDEGQYCKPVINDDGGACFSDGDCTKGTCVQTPSGENRCRFSEGFCVESDGCDADLAGGSNTNCKTAEVCVKVSSSATACLTGCQVTPWLSTYRDNCGDQLGSTKYCTPVGVPGSQRLVCLDTTTQGAQIAGNTCSSVDNPCFEGAACTRPTTNDPFRCYNHCDHENATAGGIYCGGIDGGVRPLCCTQLNRGINTDPVGDDFGICRSACTAND